MPKLAQHAPPRGLLTGGAGERASFPQKIMQRAIYGDLFLDRPIPGSPVSPLHRDCKQLFRDVLN